MRVTGTATLNQPPDAVWSALNDPDTLASAVPGCERLDVTGPGACELIVRAGIAAVAGRYAGEARAAERQAPGLIRATVAGSGNRGQVAADVTVRLEPSGEAATQVSYEADLRAEGPVAAVGQRVLASVAKRLASQFLAAVDTALSAPPVVAANSRDAAGADGADDDAGLVERARHGIATGGGLLPAGAEPRPAGARPGRVLGANGVRAALAACAVAVIAGVAIGVVVGRRARGTGESRANWGSRGDRGGRR
ncbi:MAG TPA: carbon monoxide dehydrogenase subunit G [Streptosporangiaceae bacterium]